MMQGKKHDVGDCMERIAVRCPNWVGDTVMATPVFAALREYLSDVEITAIGRRNSRAVLENNPHIDNLWIADDHGLGSILSLSNRIRAERFDAAILLPGSFRSVLPFFLGGAKRRIGYARDNRGMMLTNPVKLTPYHEQCHQVVFYLDLLMELGIEAVDDRLKRLLIVPGSDARQQVETVLQKRGLNRNQLLVSISPGAAYGSAKCYLPERFAQLADRLTKKYDATVILLGAPSEAPLCKEIADLCTVPVHDLSQDIDLPCLIALCERLGLFITNDCGSMHIAAAMRTPLVAIFGPTDPKRTAPYDPEASIVEAIHTCGCDIAPCYKRVCPIDHRCMKAVEVSDVEEAIEMQIDRLRKRA